MNKLIAYIIVYSLSLVLWCSIYSILALMLWLSASFGVGYFIDVSSYAYVVAKSLFAFSALASIINLLSPAAKRAIDILTK